MNPSLIWFLCHWATVMTACFVGASSSCQQNCYDGFLLMWCNFKFKGVLFRSDSRHNERVDSLLECATKQAVMTVAQWHRNQIKDGFMLTRCYFKFDGVLKIHRSNFVGKKMRPLRPTRPSAYAHISTMVNPALTTPWKTADKRWVINIHSG
jgi:hypothetical protein